MPQRRLLVAKRTHRAGRARSYADLALSPVEDETSLALLTETSGVQAAMAHARKIAELTGTHA